MKPDGIKARIIAGILEVVQWLIDAWKKVWK